MLWILLLILILVVVPRDYWTGFTSLRPDDKAARLRQSVSALNCLLDKLEQHPADWQTRALVLSAIDHWVSQWVAGFSPDDIRAECVETVVWRVERVCRSICVKVPEELRRQFSQANLGVQFIPATWQFRNVVFTAK